MQRRILVSIKGVFLVFAFTAMASDGKPTPKDSFEWPDASHYWRVLVNVNQYIKGYVDAHPNWFSNDKLITDFAICDVKSERREQAAKDYKAIRTFLESRGMSVGTYTSGTTVSPEAEQKEYPRRKVSTEQMPHTSHYSGSWPGHTSTKFIDVSDPDTRHALQTRIRDIWASVPSPVRFVDNAAIHHSTSEETQPWIDYCKNMRELREIGESLHSRLIFNLSVHLGMLSDSEATQLIDAVGHGGVALEMPWAHAIRESAEDTLKAQRRYRQLLDAGIAVIMIPVETPEKQLADWTRTWRKPSDHLYIAGEFWKAPRAIDDIQ